MKVLVCSPKKMMINTYNRNNPEFTFFSPENVKKIETLFDEVIWNEKDEIFTTEELKEKVKDVDAVITCWGSNTFDKEIIDCAPKLKIIAHLAGTVAWLVTPDVFDKGIMVCGANDREFSESVAEAALLYSLAKLRNFDYSVRLMRNEKAEGWRKKKITRGLFDRTVGIVSFGAIAEYFAGLLQPFHCNIKVYSRRPLSQETLDKYNMTQVSLDEIFETCDVISLHTAWNKHTEKMINEKLIKSMKDGAVLVNTARGKIIDEDALIKELKTGRISAALDVFCHEPLCSESILYDLDNVAVLPHQGGPTPDRYPYIAKNMIDDIYNYLTKGTVPDCVITRERVLCMSVC